VRSVNIALFDDSRSSVTMVDVKYQTSVVLIILMLCLQLASSEEFDTKEAGWAKIEIETVPLPNQTTVQHY